jgi:hypothetical protein
VGEIYRRIVLKAVKRHIKIFPCSNRKNFQECFTLYDDKLLFWYNTIDGNTHLLMQSISPQKESPVL